MILALTLAASLGVTTLEGEPLNPFEHGSGAQALVFVFVHPDCPVSNRYVPELNRLYAAYRERRVRMWVVYSGAERLEAIRAHYTTYGIRLPALLDPSFALADRVGATTTGEAAVYGARDIVSHTLEWLPVYRGRIDDRAARVGVWRPVATARDLVDVLQRLATGEALTYRTTQAVGCYLKPLS